jgi:glycosyltransferase involved in cell wall biosynthesis
VGHKKWPKRVLTSSDIKKPTRLIFGADPLLNPATGIGHYSRHLLLALYHRNLISDLKLYAEGRFLANEQHLNSVEPPSFNDLTSALTPWQQMRATLANNRVAVRAHAQIMPWLGRVRLRRFRDSHLYHSPNFLLPNFEGPAVSTFHDLSILRFPEFHPVARVKFMEGVMRHAVERGSHIITDAEAVKNEVQDFYGLDSNKVTAIHLGVSDVFRARGAAECLSLSNYGLQYRQFFLFVGSLEPRKNIVRIIEAYLSARQKSGFSWPLILVGGPGWQNSRELEAIENLTQLGWGRYLGPVTQQALTELYASTRALVFPSIYEGFGLPALEAQRSGTPTITSAGSAMAEFNCAADTLVNPLDVQEIAAAISHAALEPPVTISLAETPAAKLTWDRTAQKTQAVYQQLQSY